MKITSNNIAVIEGDECISKWVEETGRLDQDRNMLPIVLRHISKGDVVIDCGGYIGDMTIAFAKAVHNGGVVIAFEPSKDAFECLVYNMQDVSHIVVCVNKGLGSENKRMSIQKVETNDGMNYLVDGDDIEVIRLDDYKLVRLDFMKIDCEGHELEVLKGAEKTIEKFRPKMLIEINQMTLERSGISRQDIYKWLRQRGYKIENIYKGQGLDEYQMDIICLP